MQQTNGINSLQGVLATTAVNETKTAPAARPSSEATASSTDKTSLSAAASSVSGSSDVRLDKVLGIQQAIANGTYHVSSDKVADKIISSLLG